MRRSELITVGSVSREEATSIWPFLARKFTGRRAAIKTFTHRDPDFVFWIAENGQVFDAKESHRDNPPKGYRHIINDPPDYGGFLRGRVASEVNAQLIVVYCRPESLAKKGQKLSQFLSGIESLPIPVLQSALVISDNGDLYGTLHDLLIRSLTP